jgi:hypothetical protein
MNSIEVPAKSVPATELLMASAYIGSPVNIDGLSGDVG